MSRRSLLVAIALGLWLLSSPSFAWQTCERRIDPKVSGMMIAKPPAEFWGTHRDQEVVLELLVKEDGSAVVRKVVETPGRNYTTSALEAIKEWTFEPGTCDGQPADMPFTARVKFEHDREHM